MSWQDDLIDRYPKLFVDSGKPEVWDGWQELIEKAVGRIADTVGDNDIKIVQIREKLGGLRIYYRGSAPDDVLEKIYDAVDLAETRADVTCEVCGTEGQLYNANGVLCTRCPEHAKDQRGQYDVVKSTGYPIIKYRDGVKRCFEYDRENDLLIEVPCPPEV